MLLYIYSLEINFLLKHFQFSNISNQDSSTSLPHQWLFKLLITI